MVNKKYNNKKTFWNTLLLDYLVKYFEIPQVPYVSQYLANTKKEVTDLSDILNPESTPRYLKNLVNEKIINEIEAKELLNNLYIFKVNTNKSLLHSFLAIFNENYRVSSWEKREYLVGLFSAKLYYDLERDNLLINKIKKSGINRNEIRKNLQEPETTETLKEFISLYFGINLIILKDTGIELIPSKGVDKLKPSILLYQYPFGNLVPIINANSNDNILTWSKSKLLEILIPVGDEKKDEEVVKKSVVVNDSTESNKNTKNTKNTGIVKIESKDEINNTYKLRELLKLNLAELQALCTKHNIEVKKEAIKKGTYKNKTKSELSEDLVTKVFV
ncbi:MAG: hypothetical protein KC414_10115 [Romboutsia sp.]|nr:hypothetical protein [Romboutsia sp.]